MSESERTLWGRKSSCNVQKAMWALYELGLDHEHVELGGKFGGTDDPAYLAMNPNGRVPTLKDGDLVIWESDAIVRYLCAKYSAGDLWPEDPAERAIADQWMGWGTTYLLRDWIDLFWNLVRTPPEKHNAKRIARNHRGAVEQFKLLDAHLEGRDYMAVDRLTIADFPTGMTLYRWYEMDIERPRTPNVDAYYARLKERPAFVDGICIPYDDLIGREGF